MHHPTDRIAHTTAFVTPVVEHWLEREIAQWVHPMKDRSDDPSHHEQTLLFYIDIYIYIYIYIENTTRVPVGDDLSYNEWFLKRILRAKPRVRYVLETTS